MSNIVAELTKFAASHEVDGERRTADLLRRTSKEITWLRRRLAERASEEPPQDKLSSLLLALLDRIELEEDHTLAGQRHQIARDCGYTVVFREEASGEQH